MVKVRSVNIAARGVVGNGGEVGLVFDEGDEFNEVLWRRRRGSIVLNSVIVGGDGRSISSRYDWHVSLPRPLQLVLNLILLLFYSPLGSGSGCMAMLVM